MNCEWIVKNIFKKSDLKNRKTVKMKVKLPHVNRKTTSEKANFSSNTDFLLDFKIRVKKISRRKSTRFFTPFSVSA